MNHQAAEQHRRCAVAGDTKRQQWDHCAANNCIIGGLAGNNALHAARTVLFRVLGTGLFHAVSKKSGSTATNPRQNSDRRANQRRDGHVADIIFEFLQAKAKALDLLRLTNGHILGVDCLKGCRRDLGDSIETDKQCQQLEAAGKIDIAESEALHAVNGTEANGRKHQAECTGDQALDHILTGKRNDQHE